MIGWKVLEWIYDHIIPWILIVLLVLGLCSLAMRAL